MTASRHSGFSLTKERYIALILSLSLSIACGASIRNVILCIGDGMGPEQVKAARYYAGTNLIFESFPYRATMSTGSADSSITDSAAAATAMATGERVNNEVISTRVPGNGAEQETMLEYFKKRGKSTGLVATAFITDATPAAFGAHEVSRDSQNAIAVDYLSQTRPNVLFGGGGHGMTSSNAIAAGYTVVTRTNELFTLNTETETFVSAQFGGGNFPYEADGLGNYPHLHALVEVALNILDNDPDGFFLMVEGSRIDHAGHINDLKRNIHETLEFANSVATVLDWMGDRKDTLLLVTADHETGGLLVVEDQGLTNYPSVTWSCHGHTATKVPVYATGPNAHLATNIVDNTNIHAVAISPGLIPEQCLSVDATPNEFHMTWTSASGDVYCVEYTEDLASTNWQPLATVTSTSARLSITDSNLINTARSYRLISQQSLCPWK